MQGILAAAPLVFLTVWLVLISFSVELQLDDETTLNLGSYANWFAGFVAQSTAALVFVAACFLLPFSKIQRTYRSEREVVKRYFRSVVVEELNESERTALVSNRGGAEKFAVESSGARLKANIYRFKCGAILFAGCQYVASRLGLADY